ncbi:hypothetical protein HC928_00010 [bacterium]|nr:hypothetical protein [bacterium]
MQSVNEYVKAALNKKIAALANVQSTFFFLFSYHIARGEEYEHFIALFRQNIDDVMMNREVRIFPNNYSYWRLYPAVCCGWSLQSFQLCEGLVENVDIHLGLRPLKARPDGYNMASFAWPAKDVFLYQENDSEFEQLLIQQELLT